MPKEFPHTLAHFLLSIGFQSMGDDLWLQEESKVRVKAMPGESQEGDICIGEDQWLMQRSSIEKHIIARVKPLRSVFARDTRIVSIDAETARAFLDNEHVKGFLKGSSYLGCIVPPHRVFRGIESSYTYEGHPLLAVAVFGKDRTGITLLCRKMGQAQLFWDLGPTPSSQKFTLPSELPQGVEDSLLKG